MTDDELDWFNGDHMTRTRHQARVWWVLTMPPDQLIGAALGFAQALAEARRLMAGQPAVP